MSNKALVGQLRKDLQASKTILILWTLLVLLTGVIGSNWFFEFVGLGWSKGEVSVWVATINLTSLGILFLFLFTFLGPFYNDPPMRIESFLHARPVSPFVFAVSKIAPLLFSVIVVFVVVLASSGGNWGISVHKVSVLLVVGSVILASASLTPNWVALLKLFSLFFLVSLCIQFIGNVPFFERENFGMGWSPNSDLKGEALVFLIPSLLVLYLQFKYRKFWMGLSVLVLGFVAAFFLLVLIKEDLHTESEVAGVSGEDIEVRLSSPSRGGYNQVQVLSLSYKWEATNLPSETSIRPLGSVTEIKGADIRWKQGGSGFTNLEGAAAEALNLQSVADYARTQRVPLLRIPVEKLQTLIQPGNVIEAKVWFEIVQFEVSGRIPFGKKGSAEVVAGKTYIRDWSVSDSEVSASLLDLAVGQADESAILLVRPEEREWTEGRIRRSRGTNTLVRSIRQYDVEWEVGSTKQQSAGRKPDREWFAESEVWLAVPREVGVVQLNRSIPIDLVSPNGEWWVYPMKESTFHSPVRPAVVLVNLVTGDVRNIVLDAEDSPERITWVEGDVIALDSGDGKIIAFDLDSTGNGNLIRKKDGRDLYQGEFERFEKAWN
ncbi:MAG: hypothetical protein AAGJ81_12235 [Verrucomicrobiota bacterium]